MKKKLRKLINSLIQKKEKIQIAACGRKGKSGGEKEETGKEAENAKGRTGRPHG